MDVKSKAELSVCVKLLHKMANEPHPNTYRLTESERLAVVQDHLMDMVVVIEGVLLDIQERRGR